MTRPSEEELLAFIEGTLDEEARTRVVDALADDPALAAELRQAVRGLDALAGSVSVRGESGASRASRASGVGGAGGVGIAGGDGGGSGAGAEGEVVRTPSRPLRGHVPAWSVAAAVAATLVLAVPLTLRLAPGAVAARATPPETGIPEASEPSFVLVLQGTWPDAGTLPEGEAARRAEEYWAWTTELARRNVLLAAGDLRWEPGERLAATGGAVPPGDVDTPDFLVGMYAVRAASYAEAEALARECPHLRYGGSVAVRRVGAGFVTTGGFGDWAG